MKRKTKDGMQHFATLSRKRPGAARSRVLQGLLSGQTVAAAARSAGVNRGTVHRWLKDPDFSGALAAGRESALRAAKDGLKAGSKEAVDVLVRMLKCKDPVQARLAATTVLDRALDIEEREDFEARLSELERVLAIRAPGLLEGRDEDRGQRPSS